MLLVRVEGDVLELCSLSWVDYSRWAANLLVWPFFPVFDFGVVSSSRFHESLSLENQ